MRGRRWPGAAAQNSAATPRASNGTGRTARTTVNAVTTAEKSPVCREDISHDTLTAVPGTYNDEEVIEIVSPSVHCLLIMVFGRLQDVLPGRRILLYTCGQTR